MTIVCSRCDGNHMRSECPTEPGAVQPIVYLRQLAVDSSTWVVCAKGDPGAVPFAPYKGEPLVISPQYAAELSRQVGELEEENAALREALQAKTEGERVKDLRDAPLSEHNAFNPATEYPRTYGELRNNIAGASVLPRGITVFDGCKVDFSKPKDGK